MTPRDRTARYAEALGDPTLRRSAARVCWRTLLDRRCDFARDHDCYPGELTVGDHPRVWLHGPRGAGRYLLTSETYDRDDAAAGRFAARHGLTVTCLGHGPYGHGTVLYVWTGKPAAPVVSPRRLGRQRDGI